MHCSRRLFTRSYDYSYARRQVSTGNVMPVVRRSSSSTNKYKMKLIRTVDKNERLRATIRALQFMKLDVLRIPAALLDIAVRHLEGADRICKKQAAFLVSCCDHRTPGARVEKKLEYLRTIWDTLPRLGIEYDVHAYGSLQTSLIKNGRLAEAGKVLDRVRDAGLEPNDYLYLGELIRCAEEDPPNFERMNMYASKIENQGPDSLFYWKYKQALVSAYTKDRDEHRLEQLFDEARAYVNSRETSACLRNCYYSFAAAKLLRGETTPVFEAIDQARRSGAGLSDGQILSLAVRLAGAGRQDAILRLLNYLPKAKHWVDVTLSYVLRLIVDGHFVPALTVLQRLSPNSDSSARSSVHASEESEIMPHGKSIYYFLLDLFHLELPSAQLLALCRRLDDCGYRGDVFKMTKVAAMDMKRADIVDMLHGSGMNRPALDEVAVSSPPQPESHQLQSGTNRVQSKEPNAYHFSLSLEFQGMSGNLDSVLDLLKKIRADEYFIDVNVMARTVIPYYYSSQFDLKTLLAVFGQTCSRDTLLTASLCHCLLRGHGEKVKELLIEFPEIGICSYVSIFGYSLAQYYCHTYDIRLVIQILRRVEKSGRPLKWCMKTLVENLTKKIGSDDLADFISGLSKAGFVMQRPRRYEKSEGSWF